ncbi:uncharacterized protein DS421_13g428560 [Arachis hypogaea]|nr:uncharacterized protein DS421_13g428560 [Arachis hypogaea]
MKLSQLKFCKRKKISFTVNLAVKYISNQLKHVQSLHGSLDFYYTEERTKMMSLPIGAKSKLENVISNHECFFFLPNPQKQSHKSQ